MPGKFAKSATPWRLAAMTILAAGLAALPAAAQEDDELTSVIRGEAASRIAMAVPPTVAGDAARLAAADEIGRTLRADLEYSGWFGLLDARGEGRIPPERLGDADAWKGVGATTPLSPGATVSDSRYFSPDCRDTSNMCSLS